MFSYSIHSPQYLEPLLKMFFEHHCSGFQSQVEEALCGFTLRQVDKLPSWWSIKVAQIHFAMNGILGAILREISQPARLKCCSLFSLAYMDSVYCSVSLSTELVVFWIIIALWKTKSPSNRIESRDTLKGQLLVWGRRRIQFGTNQSSLAGVSRCRFPLHSLPSFLLQVCGNQEKMIFGKTLKHEKPGLWGWGTVARRHCFSFSSLVRVAVLVKVGKGMILTPHCQLLFMCPMLGTVFPGAKRDCCRKRHLRGNPCPFHWWLVGSKSELIWMQNIYYCGP